MNTYKSSALAVMALTCWSLQAHALESSSAYTNMQETNNSQLQLEVYKTASRAYLYNMKAKLDSLAACHKDGKFWNGTTCIDVPVVNIAKTEESTRDTGNNGSYDSDVKQTATPHKLCVLSHVQFDGDSRDYVGKWRCTVTGAPGQIWYMRYGAGKGEAKCSMTCFD